MYLSLGSGSIFGVEKIKVIEWYLCVYTVNQDSPLSTSDDGWKGRGRRIVPF